MDASGSSSTQPTASSSTAGSATASTSSTPAPTSAGAPNAAALASASGQPELNADLVAVLQSYLKSSGNGVSDQVLRDVAATLQASLQGKAGGTQWTAAKFLAYLQDQIRAMKAGTATAQPGQVQGQQPVASTSTSATASTSATPATGTAVATTTTSAAVAAAKAQVHPAMRAGSETSASGPSLAWTNPADGYPAISQSPNYTNPGHVQWAPARPTLTGGLAAGRVSGTPAQIAKNPDDSSGLTLDDNRSRRKNTPGDQSMRRTIQDLVASIDPNVKIEPEVEDLLLSIADEFIDSVTNFACRLAKHRGGDTLEVRDLQLHLERNHNIRIPGFASDETRMSLAQSSLAMAGPPAANKKNPQGTHMTLRSQRLAQVQQAKREGKLM